jgi:glycosyltransferase involved in cell wall biosynthesis
MSGPPTVTIGLPVYNGADFLAAAVESLLAQTFTDFELVISDNGSTDATQAIARRYAAQDCRVFYHRGDRNRGAAWNHNHVLALARGRYFKWAAHDDVCAPQFIERCVAVLEADPSVVLCYPRSLLIDRDGQPIRPCVDDCALDSPRPSRRFRHLLQNLGLSNPMYGLIRAAALRSIRPLGNYPGADQPLLAELVLRGRFVQVRDTLFLRRDHANRSGALSADLAALATWYDPRNAHRPVSRRWRLLTAYCAAVTRTPMSLPEHLSCYAYLAKWARRNLSGLASEATRVVAFHASRGHKHAPAP